jgi:hypothetical protein
MWTDAVARRRLLTTLFDAIYIEAGQVVKVKPRADRLAEVVSLMEAIEGPKALVSNM